MTICDSVKGTISTAVDTIASVTRTVVDKNRTNAKLNRLRIVMKSESELMNRAYIALGKACYDSEKKGAAVSDAERAKLFAVIERSKAKIAKARECYRKIVDNQNDIFYGSASAPQYDSSDIVDITVACSNENEYESSPFAAADEPEQSKAKDKLSDLKEELDSKRRDDGFAQPDADEADDAEAPDGEPF